MYNEEEDDIHEFTSISELLEIAEKNEEEDMFWEMIEDITSYTDREAEIVVAFCLIEGLNKSDLSDIEIKDNTLEYGRKEYTCGDDNEMDELWDEQLENYIDDCILPELDERYHNYFDREAWKNDARDDGRAHVLSGYDGNELSETVNGTTYYFYRTN